VSRGAVPYLFSRRERRGYNFDVARKRRGGRKILRGYLLLSLTLEKGGKEKGDYPDCAPAGEGRKISSAAISLMAYSGKGGKENTHPPRTRSRHMRRKGYWEWLPLVSRLSFFLGKKKGARSLLTEKKSEEISYFTFYCASEKKISHGRSITTKKERGVGT